VKKPLVLHGTVTGRARANAPVDTRGIPKPASHDTDVTVTLTFPVPGARSAEFDIKFESLERGFLEIGQGVKMQLLENEDA